jgi:cytosine/adenosine deaminase-related metal-dependent hydrolase
VTALTLRNARLQGGQGSVDVRVEGDRVASVAPGGSPATAEREVDLAGRLLLPGLVNAHDHLDFSTFPPLGRPPYASVYDWAADVDAGKGDPAARAALAVPLVDRLFLGGLRNLLAGATAVAHHGAFHRSLAREGFPVRVLARYGFAHSPGLTRDLRKTYRTTDRRVPWLVHAAEGGDERCRAEVALLAEKNLLRENTVIVHGIATSAEDAARIAAAGASVVWCPESNRHLYGRAAPVAQLRSAGVRIGLGSDSPVSGVRDPLSNLAAARREGVFSDEALLELATRESAAVARLPVGGVAAGAPADLIAVEGLPALLDGRRAAIALVLVAGRALYGAAELAAALLPKPTRLAVEGTARLLDGALGRRAAALRKRPPAAPWFADLKFELG